MQDYHAEFVEIYNKNITRPGADLAGNHGFFHRAGLDPVPRCL